MKILVSACLIGHNCKYTGGNNTNAQLLEFLKDKEAISVCPEVLGGLATPRPPSEIRDGIVLTSDGHDVTAEYNKGCEIVLERIKNESIDCAILQSRSPSCGVNRIYDGTFSKVLIPGNGVFATALINAGYRTIDIADLASEFNL